MGSTAASLMKRLSMLFFLLLVGAALASQWDVRADQPEESVPAESSVNRLRKWLGKAPRGAPPSQVGKNHELVRRAFRDVVARSNRSTVQVMSGDEQIALGTIVGSDGYILTKFSELKKPIRCRIPGHGVTRAQVVGRAKSLDLSLLKVDKSDLSAISLKSTNPSRTTPLGSWVAAPGGFMEQPLVVGVVSGSARRIRRDTPVIGVQIEDTPDGVVIKQVIPGGGAEAVGMEEDDVVKKVNDVVVRSSPDLERAIRRASPGSKVDIVVSRNGQRLSFTPELGRQTNLGMAEQGLLAHEGGPLSERRSGFSRAIQHDCLIQPHQCGGPLVDLSGNVIGINIARAGRAASYALPLSDVALAVQDMLSQRAQ